jgi:hypothetical protein
MPREERATPRSLSSAVDKKVAVFRCAGNKNSKYASRTRPRHAEAQPPGRDGADGLLRPRICYPPNRQIPPRSVARPAKSAVGG